MTDKKLFRCTICNDVHFGIAGPEICPTCKNKNVYVESNADEVKKIIEL